LIKVLDFGISRLERLSPSTSMTGPSAVMGTPMYMSPEQLRDASAVDARSDIWSIGVVLYELVTGAPPFSGASLGDIAIKIASEPPPSFSEQTFIEVPAAKLNVDHFWAPETFYDADTEQYLVSWASPLVATPNPQPHSIYYSLTKDFVTFSDPALLYGRADRDLIDATIVKQGSSYFMFMKDEAAGQKNLRVVSSPSLFDEGAWADPPSGPISGTEPAEGPATLMQSGQLLLLFDKYASGGLGALRSRDLVALTDVADWEDISTSVFAAPMRHGSVVELPYEVFRAVALRAAQ
jgi:serine/threonine protein kinase